MRPTLVVVLLGIVPGAVQAQSSQFGVRGLGFPNRALAVHAIGSGGAFGLFDSESSQNPAAIIGVPTLTSVFTVTQSFRQVENPAGTASVRDARFPQLMVAGPIRRLPAAVGFSYSNYTSRDFSLSSSQIIELRGVPVGVSDVFSSRGGLSDLRVAGAYRLRQQWAVGLGLHVITGSTRLTSTRVFDNPNYLSSRQRSEVSFAGTGVSLGVMGQFGPGFGVALVARWDGHVNIDRDSARVGQVDLPYTFGAGIRWRPLPGIALGGEALFRTWSAANSDLLQQGGTGARNTLEVSGGAEYTPDPKRPYRRPLRVGAHYARLPFPLVPGARGHEFGVSAGSGLRFAQHRAGIDVAVEHVWRSEGPYSERGFIVSAGVSVRP